MICERFLNYRKSGQVARNAFAALSKKKDIET
jgi:hypothetical protein